MELSRASAPKSKPFNTSSLEATAIQHRKRLRSSATNAGLRKVYGPLMHFVNSGCVIGLGRRRVPGTFNLLCGGQFLHRAQKMARPTCSRMKAQFAPDAQFSVFCVAIFRGIRRCLFPG
jgi:hypothetical protein